MHDLSKLHAETLHLSDHSFGQEYESDFELPIPSGLVGTVQSIQNAITILLNDIAVHEDLLDKTYQFKKISHVSGSFGKFSTFGFQILESPHPHIPSGEVATVYIAKSRSDRNMVVPLIVPNALNSIGGKLQSKIEAKILEEFGERPMGLIRERTGYAFTKAVHEAGGFISRVKYYALAFLALGSAGYLGTPRIIEAYNHNQDLKYSQSVRSLERWEALSSMVATLNNEQQLAATKDVFDSVAAAGNFYADFARIISRNNYEAQIRAIRAAKTFVAIESTRKGGFLDSGPDLRASYLIHDIGELALESKSESVREESLKALQGFMESRNSSLPEIKEELKKAFLEISQHSTDPQMRQVANECLSYIDT